MDGIATYDAVCRTCQSTFPVPRYGKVGHPAYCSEECRVVARAHRKIAKSLYDKGRYQCRKSSADM